MPIGPKKMDNVGQNVPEEKPVVRSGECRSHSNHGCCKSDFGKKILMTLFGVLLVYLTFYVGTLMRNNIKEYYYIGQADQMERTITINGTGKVTATNDIAVTTIGYSNIDSDVSKAQAENKKVMDQVTDEVKKLGVDEKDIRSNYTMYPEYDYLQGKGQVLKGYRVTNNLTIKIRDLTKVSQVLSLPGKYGANQVSGLSFTIDETENLKVQAREKALADAKKKALALAQNLGLAIGEVVSYNDYDAQPYYDRAAYGLANEAMGGSGPSQVLGGSQDVSMNVMITFKVYSNR